MESIQIRFLMFLGILAVPLAAGAFLLSWSPANTYFNQSPSNDGYVAPRDISKLIDDTLESTVVVICEKSKSDVSIGTGWSFENDLLQVKTDKTVLMTNFHVIKNCLKKTKHISIAQEGTKLKSAQIHIFDKANDLAVLTTDFKLPTLKLSSNGPWPGYWVMAIGSAGSHAGSVAFGNVLNVTNKDILITNNISDGNSGGPLVDNEGHVLGMVTWGMDYKNDQYSGARILDVFCLKLIECTNEYEDEVTWFEYIE